MFQAFSFVARNCSFVFWDQNHGRGRYEWFSGSRTEMPPTWNTLGYRCERIFILTPIWIVMIDSVGGDWKRGEEENCEVNEESNWLYDSCNNLEGSLAAAQLASGISRESFWSILYTGYGANLLCSRRPRSDIWIRHHSVFAFPCHATCPCFCTFTRVAHVTSQWMTQIKMQNAAKARV